jgi:omega-6 fatty acid desaturase (delta-12 desaturase)
MTTNAAIAAVVVGMMWLIGWKTFLLIQIPITVIAGVIGVWLFFIQHQFEGTFWADGEAWNVHDAALRGSSYYALPSPLAWLTAHIGIHHVHHLYARIPFYRLPQVLRDQAPLASASRVTLWQSLKYARLALWDDAQNKLLSFREARKLPH